MFPQFSPRYSQAGKGRFQGLFSRHREDRQAGRGDAKKSGAKPLLNGGIVTVVFRSVDKQVTDPGTNKTSFSIPTVKAASLMPAQQCFWALLSTKNSARLTI
jgi:hypothetical protein